MNENLNDQNIGILDEKRGQLENIRKEKKNSSIRLRVKCITEIYLNKVTPRLETNNGDIINNYH